MASTPGRKVGLAAVVGAMGMGAIAPRFREAGGEALLGIKTGSISTLDRALEIDGLGFVTADRWLCSFGLSATAAPGQLPECFVSDPAC